MKSISNTLVHDFDSYIFRYTNKYATKEPGDSLSLIYQTGYLPYSGSKKAKDIFYMARSARIVLKGFKLTSENRRIAKKFDGAFQKEHIALADFTITEEFLNFCLSYFAQKHGAGAMPRERLEFILSCGLISSVVVYSKDDESIAYVLEVSDKTMAHFWFSFYDLSLTQQSLGLWLMLDCLRDSKIAGLEYYYLGTVYGEKALYKTNFEPLQWWDGTQWQSDKKILKEQSRMDRDKKMPEKKILQTADGCSIYYETVVQEGARQTIFFVHGVGGDLDAWNPIRDALVAWGYSTVAMDLRGHGYSSHPKQKEKYRKELVAGDMQAIIEKEKLTHVALVGHCYGAVAAAHCVAQSPASIEQLVLISGAYGPPPYLRRQILQNIANFGVALGAFLSPPRPRRGWHSPYPAGKHHKDYELYGLARTIFYNSLKSYLYTTRELINLDLLPALASVRIPTLVIVGDQDSIFPAHISKKIHGSIPGSVLHIVEGANHPVILNNPAEVVGLILTFLQKR